MGEYDQDLHGSSPGLVHDSREKHRQAEDSREAEESGELI
jgi:hypothetical protein